MKIPEMHVIDTEYGEKEINVYANTEDMNTYDDCMSGTENSETNRKQTSQHTGSERGMNRRYRSITVCLVVLCVLLLTAVIVLHVLIKNLTEERDQLLTKYTKLTEVRDLLQTKYISITKERDQLLSKSKNLTTKNDILLTNNSNLNNQREQLTQVINTTMEILKADGWIYCQSSLYFISSEQKSWSESRRYCRERGADLIIINNKEEQDFITKNFGEDAHWIGLSDSDDKDSPTNSTISWRSEEPNDQTKNNCAVSYYLGRNYTPCYSAQKCICKRNISISL